eukprot:Selendium_serpulae@DN2334_c0_g1_i2.p1
MHVHLGDPTPSEMKVFGFDSYQDPKMLPLLRKCLVKSRISPRLIVASFSDVMETSSRQHHKSARLFSTKPYATSRAKLIEEPELTRPLSRSLEGRPIVMHTNGDGFGQNIEMEKATSLHGTIGAHSDAALTLNRRHPQLTAFVVNLLVDDEDQLREIG